ncbi:MAG: hypothetical protein ACYS0G_04075 [Planctomycetota bacterium]|jgi:hypothetical protein
MVALRIVMDEWPLVVGLLLSFLAGVILGLATCVRDRERARRLGEELDARRTSTRPVYRLVQRRHGAWRAAFYILVANLLGGALLRSSVGGLFILPPFLWLVVLGRLLVLTLARYRERRFYAVPVVPFELAAFIVASVGGIGITRSLFLGEGAGLALKEWAILFGTLVVPLQLVGALLEGILIHRTYVVQRKPLPEKATE